MESLSGGASDEVRREIDVPRRSGRPDGDIDLTGITFRDPAALPVLRSLLDSAHAEGFRIHGLGWHQVLELMHRTPLSGLARTCAEIRSILHGTRRPEDDPTPAGSPGG